MASSTAPRNHRAELPTIPSCHRTFRTALPWHLEPLSVSLWVWSSLDAYTFTSVLSACRALSSYLAFEEIEHKDVISWNVLISSFLKTGFVKEGIGVFRQMQTENVFV
ncbi:hypothetical protein MLD38_006437 [Melastoma candidum]|nr:hypothetical protein MLD38_006437 [Melastoma candidum]